MLDATFLNDYFVFCDPRYHLRIKLFTLATSKILTKSNCRDIQVRQNRMHARYLAQHRRDQLYVSSFNNA